MELRPLTEEFWRPAALLIRSIYRELGTVPPRPLKLELAVLASPWLGDQGEASVLLDKKELVGFGWTRDETLMDRQYVHTGLFLARSARTQDRYRCLTGPLLESAARLGRLFGFSENRAMYRSIDTIHPPIVRAIGFRDLPATMIGYNHDLLRIPDLPPPTGVIIRPARMPDELPRVMEFAKSCIDDLAHQTDTGDKQRWDMLADELATAPEQLLVAETVTGLAGYVTVTRYDAPAGAATIGEFGIVPGLRRRGIASSLISCVLLNCRRRRIRRVLISEPSTSPAGILLWRLGFRPDALMTYYYFSRPLA